MGDVGGIAGKVVDRYSQDGIVSLSFGLLLLALLYFTWQQTKQWAKEREAWVSSMEKEREAAAAREEKKSAEFMGHVVKFTESTNASTAVTNRAVEAIEDLTAEFRGLKTDVEKLTDRVDRMGGGRA